MRIIVLLALVLLSSRASAAWWEECLPRWAQIWGSKPVAARQLRPATPVLTHLTGTGNSPLDPVNEMNFKVWGKGKKPTIVLIHGFGSSQKTFAAAAEELSKKFLVITYDKRAHGGTVARGNDYGSESAAADLKALLDHLGIEKAIVLGHSLGGRTALRFADKYPDRVERLVIEDMAFLPLTGEYPLDPDFQEKAAALAPLSGSFETRAALETAVKSLVPWFKSEPLLQDVRQHDDKHFSLASPPDAYLLEYSQGITEDMTRPLKRLTVPTLVLVADKQSDFTSEGLDHLKKNAKSATVRFIPGSHHSIHNSDPQVFLSAVTAFAEGKKLSPKLVKVGSKDPRKKN